MASIDRAYRRFVTFLVVAALAVVAGLTLPTRLLGILNDEAVQRVSDLLEMFLVTLFFGATLMCIGVTWAARILAARRYTSQQSLPFSAHGSRRAVRLFCNLRSLCRGGSILPTAAGGRSAGVCGCGCGGGRRGLLFSPAAEHFFAGGSLGAARNDFLRDRQRRASDEGRARGRGGGDGRFGGRGYGSGKHGERGERAGGDAHSGRNAA